MSEIINNFWLREKNEDVQRRQLPYTNFFDLAIP